MSANQHALGWRTDTHFGAGRGGCPCKFLPFKTAENDGRCLWKEREERKDCSVFEHIAPRRHHVKVLLPFTASHRSGPCRSLQFLLCRKKVAWIEERLREKGRGFPEDSGEMSRKIARDRFCAFLPLRCPPNRSRQ